MKRYSVILADPPWKFGSKAYQDGDRNMLKLEKAQYNTLSIEEIKSLPIRNISEKDCALFLWTTDAHLKEAIEVLESWGFKYKTIAFVWLKKYKSGSNVYNFAPWTLKSHEICLLGIRGQMGKHKTANNIKGFVEAVRDGHSKKPFEVMRRIEGLFERCSKIELFARRKNDGWDSWGDEVECDVDLDIALSGDSDK